ncbi:hypothetical protein EDEG_01631 [Edhazardia aedis USNM 41457]|uniref:Uncharacterized protein n=1 Tax=Edhazardia aedis (strain USNM 41457) TaxID=1003232 RepID=J9DNF6_EDHAE|nr:hypothetical protein EDEG_01631 [Edhazardia aedis USNM 41457]|eukprot:EJW04055.1 hypothetical protein EDEG_01631 [Edhazardia aedis USNM 41457]
MNRKLKPQEIQAIIKDEPKIETAENQAIRKDEPKVETTENQASRKDESKIKTAENSDQNNTEKLKNYNSLAEKPKNKLHNDGKKNDDRSDKEFDKPYPVKNNKTNINTVIIDPSEYDYIIDILPRKKLDPTQDFHCYTANDIYAAVGPASGPSLYDELKEAMKNDTDPTLPSPIIGKTVHSDQLYSYNFPNPATKYNKKKRQIKILQILCLKT